jgi:hypothetical protein
MLGTTVAPSALGKKAASVTRVSLERLTYFTVKFSVYVPMRRLS